MPICWVRLGHHVGVGYADVLQLEGTRSESHGHAVVVIGIDNWVRLWGAATAVPADGRFSSLEHIAQLREFGRKRFDAVGLFYAKSLQACEPERHIEHTASDHDGLSQVGTTGEIVTEYRL